MIKVTVTCAWCQTMEETTLEDPIPTGWVNASVKSPDRVDVVQENFCGDVHRNHYKHYAPLAHESARVDYVQKFYSEMNVLRAGENATPRDVSSEEPDSRSLELDTRSSEYLGSSPKHRDPRSLLDA